MTTGVSATASSTSNPRRPKDPFNVRRRSLVRAGCAVLAVCVASGLDARAGLLLAVGLFAWCCWNFLVRGRVGQATALVAAVSVGEFVSVRDGASGRKLTLFLVTASLAASWIYRNAPRLLPVAETALTRRAAPWLVLLAWSPFVLRLAPLLPNFDLARFEVGSLGPLQIGEFTRPLAVGVFAVQATFLSGSFRSWGIRQIIVVAPALSYVLLLIAAGDFGPAVLTSVGLLVVLLTARPQNRRALLVFAFAFSGVVALGLAAGVGHDRLLNVLNPDRNAQLLAALAGATWGGLIGDGNNPYLGPTYAADTDLLPAFAIGLLGSIPVAVIVLFLLFTLGRRLVQIDAVRNSTNRRLALGLMSMIITAEVWAIGANTDFLPLSGFSAPFLVVTGSSIIPTVMTVALVSTIADRGSGRNSGGVIVGATGAVVAAPVALMCSFAVLACGFLPARYDADPALLGPPGRITTRDGHIVAATDGAGKRTYPRLDTYLEMGYDQRLPGYTAHLGVEGTQAAVLTCGGERPHSGWSRLMHPYRCTPGHLVLSLDSTVQRAATSADHADVAVLDSKTGDLLGLASSRDTTEPASTEVDTDQVHPSAIYHARYGGLTPGAPMKIVTVAAGMLNGTDLREVDDEAVTVPGGTLVNEDGTSCASASWSALLASSCNARTARVALQIGRAKLDDVSTRYFGFASEGAVPDSLKPYDGGWLSAAATGLSAHTGRGDLARSAIGQQGVTASAVNLAEIGAVVARAQQGRSAPAPRIVAAECRTATLRPRTNDRTIGVDILPSDDAKAIERGMLIAAEDAGIHRTARSRATVALKTGIAGTDETAVAIVGGRFVVAVIAHDTSQPVDATRAVGIVSAVADTVDGVKEPSCQ